MHGHPPDLSLGRLSPASFTLFAVSSHWETNRRPFPLHPPQLPLEASKDTSYWPLSFHIILHLGKPSLGEAKGLAQVISSEVVAPGLDLDGTRLRPAFAPAQPSSCGLLEGAARPRPGDGTAHDENRTASVDG